jgi:hypothetical protein
MFTVHNWQFIEERFVPSKTFATETEAWAYVRSQIDAGKDRSRFKVEQA